MAAIRTKVDRLALIKRLNETLKNNDKAIAANKKRKVALDKLRDSYSQDILKAIKPKDVSKVEYESENHYRQGTIRIYLKGGVTYEQFNTPDDLEPQRQFNEWEIREIHEALKVLELSTESDISMAALRDIAKFL